MFLNCTLKKHYCVNISCLWVLCKHTIVAISQTNVPHTPENTSALLISVWTQRIQLNKHRKTVRLKERPADSRQTLLKIKYNQLMLDSKHKHTSHTCTVRLSVRLLSKTFMTTSQVTSHNNMKTVISVLNISVWTHMCWIKRQNTVTLKHRLLSTLMLIY